jgi:tRNA-2-methylthio-N6-dimethylallyladenosine synthase
MVDDVSEEEKGQRVNEITTMQHVISLELNNAMVGKTEQVLIDGDSRKSSEEWAARTDTNKVIVFPKGDERAGDFIRVRIQHATSTTLMGTRVHEEETIEAAA